MVIPSRFSGSDINCQDRALSEIVADIRSSNPNGVSGIPSSMQPGALANESGGGGICANICSCLAHLFSKICQLFRQCFASSSSDALTRNSLENTIKGANRIIDSHFESKFITDAANQQNSAIVTTFKFNGLMEISCGRTPDERGNVNGIKNLLKSLITREYERSGDDKIDIKTYLIKKNSDNTWNLFHEDDCCYLYRDPSNARTHSGSGSSVGNSLAAILRKLQAAISNNPEAAIRIGAVIKQL
jgi:hypothetical protein